MGGEGGIEKLLNQLFEIAETSGVRGSV